MIESILFLLLPGLTQLNVDGQCYGSPPRVLTELPYTSSGESFVTSMWAYVLSDGSPLAWVYRNHMGQYALQINSNEERVAHRALGSVAYPGMFDRGLTEDGTMAAVFLGKNEFERVDELLTRYGAERRECAVRQL